MNYLHEAQLANIVTSYCTCLAGIMPMLYTLLTRRQPGRWFFAYFCILLTGIPTVWLHSAEGDRVASFFDVGSNILLAWAIIIAVSGDFLSSPRRRVLLGVVTVCDVIAWAWLLYEIFAPEKRPLMTFGAFGQFYVGETVLIANAWVVAILFALNYRRIPAPARPLLLLTLGMFFIGMLTATASNSEITWRIIPWHAAWHIIGAFGFITFWLFNHVRFNEAGHGRSEH